MSRFKVNTHEYMHAGLRLCLPEPQLTPPRNRVASCLVQLKPRRVVVVNARSVNKFDYTMMDMDDTKYVQPHNASLFPPGSCLKLSTNLAQLERSCTIVTMNSSCPRRLVMSTDQSFS